MSNPKSDRLISFFAWAVVSGTLGVFLWPDVAIAQNRPWAWASYEFYTPAGLDNEPFAGAAPNMRVAAISPRIFVSIPVVLNGGRTILDNRFHYNAQKFIYEDGPRARLVLPSTLQEFKYELRVQQRITSRWDIRVGVRPGLASDLRGVDSNHLRFETGFVLRYLASEFGKVGLGAMVQNEFGDTDILPTFYLSLGKAIGTAGTGLRVEVRIPKLAAIWVPVRPNVDLGLAAAINGNRYRLGDQSGGLVNFVKYSVLSVGPGIIIGMSPRTAFTFNAGIAMRLKFDVRDRADDTLTEVNLKPVPFFRVGLLVRRSER